MKTKFLLIFAILFVLTACNQKQPVQTSGIDLNNLDTTTSAQNDFYQYACGGWIKNNPIPNEYPHYGVFEKLSKSNYEIIKNLIAELASTQNKQGDIAQKIGDFYNLAMDSVRINAEGYEPIRPMLQKIAATTNKTELATLLSELNLNGGSNGFFDMFVDADIKNSEINILYLSQGGFALSERDYYLEDDEHTINIRNKYTNCITNMFTLCEFSNEQAKKNANTILRIETTLAKAALDNVASRDPNIFYNKIAVDSLQKLTPQFNWDIFFSGLNIHTKHISIENATYFKTINDIITNESLENIITYLQWHVINNASSFLSEDFRDENFEMYGKTLLGRKEKHARWKFAINTLDAAMGEAVGQMYVQKYFPPEAKKRMLNLVENLRIALGERISTLTWMSDSTKAKAHEKLATLGVKIGYPDKWRDYSDLEIDKTESFYTNWIRAEQFHCKYEISFIDKPINRDRWFMTPQTINAYYEQSRNEICFPAGILQPPFFNLQADDAYNYGTIGAIIGHEITHGFDNNGCKFDENGNLHNWWTESDKANFENRTQVLVDYFNAIEVAPDVHANGEFTLGENIADLGGLQIAFQAFKNATKNVTLDTIDGFSPEQRFFLAYAHSWANSSRTESILFLTKSDPHSLPEWRVNGILPHISAWYEAFHITESSPMYIAPEKRANIW